MSDKSSLVSAEDHHAGVNMFERLLRDPSVDVAKLEKMMQMQERVDARNAEQAFNAAMSSAQSEMRPISADANNPQTRSKYASYAALDKALRPIYTKHGFALSFDTGDAPVEQTVRVLCYLTHSEGHSKTYKADMAADGKGAKGGDVMTKIHAAGSAMSYGMRYLLKMIFNVAVGEEDDDGNRASSGPPINENQQIVLDELIDTAANGKDKGIYKAKFCKWLKVESLGDLPSTSFEPAKAELNRIIAANEKKAA